LPPQSHSVTRQAFNQLTPCLKHISNPAGYVAGLFLRQYFKLSRATNPPYGSEEWLNQKVGCANQRAAHQFKAHNRQGGLTAEWMRRINDIKQSLCFADKSLLRNDAPPVGTS